MKILKYMVLILSISLCGCTNESDAKKALATTNLINIQFTGYRLFCCGKDDFYSTGFSAELPNGNKISGSVCSGILFKGTTIRYD